MNTLATRPFEVAASPRIDAVTPARVALWTMLAAKLVGGWGLRWDIQWHITIGRDSFWIAPHVMTYASVTMVVLVSFGLLAFETARRRRASSPTTPAIRMLGLDGTRGAHLAAWGIALTVLAAPIDDLWHRLFGLDVTLWSPPHLLGLVGAAVNTLGCILLAREVYPARSRAGLGATLIAGAMFYGVLRIGIMPAFDLAYRDGGLAFHAHALLGALFIPLALVTAAQLTGARWAPLAIAAISALMALSGDAVAHAGFAMLQPVSVIQEAIAQDPSSPIAVANAIARKNGEQPGTMGLVPLVISLLTVTTLVLVDARRHPRLATLVYATAVFVVTGALLALSPAFGPNTPDRVTNAVALALTLLAALGGAEAATRLTRMLAPRP